MNSSYGGVTTTGGRAWRHNCSVRVSFTKSDYIDDKGVSVSRSVENPSGHLVKVALTKSKVCKLDRKVGFYTLKYLDGIDHVSDIIDLAIKYSLISVAGAWYSIINPETGELYKQDDKDLKFQGKAKLHEFLTNDKNWLNTINGAINQQIL
jgi:recombination protein RecA